METKIPKFTAQVLTDIAFSYTRWTKFLRANEEYNSVARKLLKETARIRTAFLGGLVRASRTDSTQKITEKMIVDRCLTDMSLARHLVRLTKQYFDEIGKSKFFSPDTMHPETQEEFNALMPEQALVAAVTLLERSGKSILAIPEKDIEEVMTKLIKLLANSFAESQQEGKDNTREIVERMKASAKTIAHGPGYTEQKAPVQ